jgi:hypothetical protein
MNMEEVEMFTAPGEGQQKKFMELSEAGFAADQEAPPNQRAHIPKDHSIDPARKQWHLFPSISAKNAEMDGAPDSI